MLVNSGYSANGMVADQLLVILFAEKEKKKKRKRKRKYQETFQQVKLSMPSEWINQEQGNKRSIAFGRW